MLRINNTELLAGKMLILSISNELKPDRYVWVLVEDKNVRLTIQSDLSDSVYLLMTMMFSKVRHAKSH